MLEVSKDGLKPAVRQWTGFGGVAAWGRTPPKREERDRERFRRQPVAERKLAGSGEGGDGVRE